MISNEPLFFRVLGPLEIRAPDGRVVDVTATKQRRLLTMLLLHANDWVTVDQLIGAIWPKNPPASARGNVKTYVHGLRKLFAASWRIESGHGGYRLNAAKGEIDAETFVDLTAKSQEAARRGEIEEAAGQLHTALALWHGEPFAPLADQSAALEASRLAELRWLARDLLADALLATDKPGEAVVLLRPLSAQDPLREPTWERLVTALHRSGRRSEALTAYTEARQTLVTELGVEPGPKLQRLHQVVLAEQARPVRKFSQNDKEERVSRPRATVGATAMAGLVTAPASTESAARTSELPTRRPEATTKPPDSRPAAGPVSPRFPVSPVGTGFISSFGPPRERRPAPARPRWLNQRSWHRLLTFIAVLIACTAAAAAMVTLATPRMSIAEAPVSLPSPLVLTDTTPADQPPRRPLVGWHAGGGHGVLFGIGDDLRSAAGTSLAAERRLSMLGAVYHTGPTANPLGSPDLAKFTGPNQPLVRAIYQQGRGINLIIRDTSSRTGLHTKYGQACGATASLAPQFLAEMRLLARTLAGQSSDPPLMVTVFGRMEHMACHAEDAGGRFKADKPTTAYFRALKDRFWEIRKIFLDEAPNARVGIGWEHWQASFNQPATGGGVSMFPYFADILRRSDFESFEAIDDLGNVPFVNQMVSQLGAYGPVVVSNYSPYRGLVPGVFEQDVNTLFQETSLDKLTRDGLYAWNFTDDQQLRAHPDTAAFVRNVIDQRGLLASPA